MYKILYKEIYKKIKKYNNIVIARHTGPDPDALASQLGLKEAIKNKFPEKNVYAIGCPASKFKYLGTLDKLPENLENVLLIVTDTPDKKRVDGIEQLKSEYSIKIDHHPFVEKFCDLELIDENASSASQIMLDFIFNTPLNLTKEVSEKLYVGLVADTDRFLFSYTNSDTFKLVSKMLKNNKIDITSLYEKLYCRPLKEIRFLGYIMQNIIVENKVGYIKLTDEVLTKFEVDAATAGNMINNLNYIDEIVVWATFSYDKVNNNIRGSIRSRGPIINNVASEFGGGGHKYASGVRLKTFEEVDKLIEKLKEIC